MARSRVKAKGRREGGVFVPLPVHFLSHSNYQRLSLAARKVFDALCCQLKFTKGGVSNNGDLCATWSLMKQRDIGSEETLQWGIKELLYYGIIVSTRQGERLRNDKPNLFAITLWGIDECGGKLDVKASPVPLGNWKDEKPKFIRPQKSKQKNKLPTTDSVVVPLQIV